MEKKILITGASGFIGGKLFKRMQGPNLFGTANSSPVNCENIIKVDLADSQATKKLLEGLKPAVIFHFAGMASPKKNDEVPS